MMQGTHEYELEAKLQGLKLRRAGQAPLTLKQLTLSNRGELGLAVNAQASQALTWLSARGQARHKELRAPGLALAQGSKLTWSLQGASPQALRGELRAQLAQVEAAQERLSWAQARVSLSERGAYTISAELQRRKRPNRVSLRGEGTVDEGLRSGRLKQLTLTLPSGRAWSVQDAGFDLRGSQLKLDGLTLSDGQQRLSVSGALRQRGEQTLRVEAQDVRLEQLLADAGIEAPLSGHVEAMTLGLKGSDQAPELDLTLRLRQLRVMGYGPLSLDVELRYAKEYLTVRRLRLEGYDQPLLDARVRLPLRASLSGSPQLIWDKNALIAFELHPLKFDELSAKIPQLGRLGLRGSLSALGTMSGTLTAPTLDAVVLGRGLGAQARVGAQRVKVEGISLEARLDYKPPTTQGAGADDHEGLRASVWVDWARQGQEERPRQAALASAQGGATPAGADRLLTLTMQTPMPVATWLANFLRRGQLPDLRRDVLGQRLTTDLQITDLELRRLDVSPLLRDADAAGRINLKLSGQGTFLDPGLRFEMSIGRLEPWPDGRPGGQSIDGLGWSQYRDVIVTAKAKLERGWFELERLEVNWDQTDILSAAARLPVPIERLLDGKALDDVPLDAELTLHPLPLAKLQAADYAFAGVPGVFKGFLSLKGKLSAPTLAAGLAIVDTQLGQGPTKDMIEVAIDASQDVVSARLDAYQGERSLLRGVARARVNMNLMSLSQGTSPLSVSAASRAQARGSTDPLLAQEDVLLLLQTHQGAFLDLREVTPRFLTRSALKRLQGKLKADVTVRGPWSQVSSQGVVQVRDALVELDALGRTFDKIQLDVALEQARYHIKQLELHESNTWVKVDGEVAHEGLKPSTVKLTTRMSGFNVGGFVDKPFFVSTKVDVQGRLDSSPLTAAIRVSDLEVRLPKQISQSLHATSLHEDIAVRNATKGDPRQAQLDRYLQEIASQLSGAGRPSAVVQVSLDPDSRVLHPMGQVTLGGELQIVQRASGPSITGEIVTMEGFAEFLGKRFLVDRGLIIFTGANPPNPRLQLEAVHVLDRSLTEAIGQPSEGRHARIIIRVTGTANDPRLRLRSDPELSDTDILYVLATGRPPESAGVGQDAGVVSAALSAASGIFLGLLQQQFQGKIPVQLRLDAGEEGLADSSIQIGRYITEDVFVSYRYRFGGGNRPSENIFEVEYHFAPRWMLEARYSDTNQGQFNVFWDAY